MGLHEAGVGDTVVGGGNTDAALALLHHDGEDEALIDTGGLGSGLDGVGDILNLGIRVITDPAVPDAGLLHEGNVGVPELIPGAPGILGRPASGGRSVTLVESVLVCDATLGCAAGSGKGRADGSKAGNNDGNVGEHFEVLIEIYMEEKERMGYQWLNLERKECFKESVEVKEWK